MKDARADNDRESPVLLYVRINMVKQNYYLLVAETMHKLFGWLNIT